MFLFFHRKPKIVIDAFTWNSAHYETMKFEKAVKYIPKWFKDMPDAVYGQSNVGLTVPMPTMRRCPAIVDYYKNSYMILNQQETLIRTSENEVFFHITHSDIRPISIFHGNQKQTFNIPHMKINSSWIFKEKSGVKFLMGDAYWNNFDQPWRVTPGILEFKYQCAVNVNLAVNRNTEQFTIPVFHPIAQLMPLSESSVEIKHHLVDPHEWDRIRDVSGYSYTFLNKYGVQKKLRQKK